MARGVARKGGPQSVASRRLQSDDAGTEVSENPSGQGAGFAGKVNDLEAAKESVCGLVGHGG